MAVYMFILTALILSLLLVCGLSALPDHIHILSSKHFCLMDKDNQSHPSEEEVLVGLVYQRPQTQGPR